MNPKSALYLGALAVLAVLVSATYPVSHQGFVPFVQDRQAKNTSAVASPAANSSSSSSSNASATASAVGPVCSPPGGLDTFKACVTSCSSSTFTCTAPNCCVAPGSNSVSFCSHGCCGLVSTGSSQVIFSASGVCDSGNLPASAVFGGNSSSNATASASASTNSTTSPANGTASTNATAPKNASISPSPAGSTITPMNGTSPFRNSSGTASTNNSCFPATATLLLESGRVIRMDELSVGDRVLVGPGMFSDVFMFTHKLSQVSSEFVAIRTEIGNEFLASPGHYLYVNGALSPAASVRAGDVLFDGKTGSPIHVVSVSTSFEQGLFNPQTLHGDIVVDGLLASTYTEAVSPVLGHSWLAPLRFLYTSCGISSKMLELGANSIVRMLPAGVSEY